MTTNTSLPTILVHVDTTKRSKRALDAALKLADQHDAHLIGLGVRQPVAMPNYAAAEIPSEVWAAMENEQENLVSQARTIFEDAVSLSGRQARSEWHVEHRDIAAAISARGKSADLIVLGQEEPNDIAPYESVPDHVVLSAGRPVLVIPYIGEIDTIGERVLIAWNNSREAARALGDSLPLLSKASDVDIVSVEDHDSSVPPGSDAARYLSGYGVKAKISNVKPGSISTDNILLNHVADRACDLIVMGAYGHSRIREMVLGGVTRHMLRHMTAPVLLSH